MYLTANNQENSFDSEVATASCVTWFWTTIFQADSSGAGPEQQRVAWHKQRALNTLTFSIGVCKRTHTANASSKHVMEQVQLQVKPCVLTAVCELQHNAIHH